VEFDQHQLSDSDDRMLLTQTLVLALLMRYLGNKHSIIIGLVFEMLQLFMLGFSSQPW